MIRRNIFEVSDDEKRRILGLHESATKRQYLFEGIGDQEVLNNLSEYCRQLEINLQTALLDRFILKVENEGGPIEDGGTLSMSIGEFELEPCRRVRYQELEAIDYQFCFPDGRMVIESDISMGQYMDKIKENADFKILLEKFPRIEEAIKARNLSLIVKSNRPAMHAWISLARPNKRFKKYAKNNTDNTLNFGGWYKFFLAKGMEDSRLDYDYGNGVYGYVQWGLTQIPLESDFKLSYDLIDGGGGTTGTTTGDTFEPISIKMPAGEPFNFDEVTLTKPGGEEAVNTFISQVNSLMQKYPKYKPFLESQKEIPVYAYSSGDGDPDANVPAKNDCPSSSRKDYDLCLSQKRADYIANMLNEGLGLTVFKGYGKGYENNKVANWTKLKPTKFKDTQPNRRFEVNLPQYTQLVQ